MDPLDGTANFVYGRPDLAVSVGVESAGTIVAGAIIRPSDGRWVLADVSLREIAIGAELSPPQTTKLAGRQHVSAAPNDEAHAADALVSFGLPHAMSARQAAPAIIRAAVPHVRGVRIAGSAASDFLAWAHGECDAFVGCGLAEWDTAAGQAIVLAARGAGRKLGTPDFDIRVAASTPLVAGLCDIVGSLRPH